MQRHTTTTTSTLTTRRPRAPRHLLRGLATAAALLALSAPQAQAGVTINFSNQGSNVVATATGVLNLDSWALQDEVVPVLQGLIQVSPEQGTFGMFLGGQAGSESLHFVFVSQVSGPGSIGPGNGQVVATGGSNPGFGFLHQGSTGIIFIEQSTPFNSGSAVDINASSTWAGTTTAGLGLAGGSSTWVWGSGASVDFLTVNVQATAPVPEPESYALMLAGLAGLGFVARRRSAA